MEVEKLANVVGLVITGVLDPEKITAQRVINFDIVTKEEGRQIETLRLDSSLSVFTISKTIEVLCTKTRLQVLGTGEVSDRVSDITKKLLESSGFDDFSSLGVNAYVDFTFKRPEDCLQFGNFFIPLPFWQDYLRDGRVSEFTMKEDHNRSYPDYRKSFTIKSLHPRQLPDGKKVADVRLSVNYDFRLDSIGSCIDVIDRSLGFFNLFWEDADSIFKKVS